MAQDTPAQMSEHDQQLFEDMMCRIELVLLWTELSSMLAPGWSVPRQHWRTGKGGGWRALPLPKRAGEVLVSNGAAAALRNVNGTAPTLCMFTDKQVQVTREVAINCIEARSNDWGDALLPWPGHRGAH
jgi:hypothetical protein